MIKELQSLGLDVKLYSDKDEELELKEHVEEGIELTEEQGRQMMEEELLEEQNLTEVSEDELENDLDDEMDMDNLEADGLFNELLGDEELDPNAILGDLDSEE